MGNKKRATCLATSLQNELNSDVAHFTTHIKPVLQQIRLLRDLNVGGKRRNISIQLVILLPIFRTFGSPDPDRVSDQKIVIFFTRFQTWPLKSIPASRPGVGRNYLG